MAHASPCTREGCWCRGPTGEASIRREEAEKWLADTLARNARWGPHGLMGGGLLLLDTARALLDAGVTVPEPPAPRYYADRHYVRDRLVIEPFTKGSTSVVAVFHDGHPIGKETAAQAEADRLNAAERGK